MKSTAITIHFLQLLLLATVLGCAPSSTPKGPTSLQTLTEKRNRTAEALEGIHDGESSAGAAPIVKVHFSEMTDVINIIAQEKGGPNISHRELEEINDAAKRLVNAISRVQRMKGLSAEFWDVLRPAELEYSLAQLQSIASLGQASNSRAIELHRQFLEMFKQHGAAQVVSLKIEDLPGSYRDEIYGKLADAAGPDALTLGGRAKMTHTVQVAPVRDFESFMAAIDFGTVTDFDSARKYIEVKAGVGGNGENGNAK